MAQPGLTHQEAALANQETRRPISIWLTQIWLLFVAVPPLLAGLLAVFHLFRGIIVQGISQLRFGTEARGAVLPLILLAGFGLLALITFWGLQKRARISRWLALFLIGFVVVKNSYYLAVDQSGLWNFVTSPIYLLQLVMLYRFSCGKAEQAFLSK